ncbi:MAG: hypothetical protein EPN73_04790 [Paraburkholderia sp.]|uniref:hypothetical protein n=1 Tax=Paraburkholderia sp. TaxID=1926495 RepID=UPI00120DCCED|nr:hypothetical protein [Paraburkholderia sp.]TAL97923.1 MAG: hypothetical protein EPN73_04790 [Paraburkholderia sp.]
MSGRERSLRKVVESWLGSEPENRLRITRVSRSRWKLWRYVCVESARGDGAMALVFFRHDDGSWCVFPPAPMRPAMGMVFEIDASLRCA